MYKALIHVSPTLKLQPHYSPAHWLPKVCILLKASLHDLVVHFDIVLCIRRYLLLMYVLCSVFKSWIAFSVILISLF